MSPDDADDLVNGDHRDRGRVVIRALHEIPADASSDLIREQIAERRDFLPRMANPQKAQQMRREIAELEHRLELRG